MRSPWSTNSGRQRSPPQPQTRAGSRNDPGAYNRWRGQPSGGSEGARLLGNAGGTRSESAPAQQQRVRFGSPPQRPPQAPPSPDRPASVWDTAWSQPAQPPQPPDGEINAAMRGFLDEDSRQPPPRGLPPNQRLQRQNSGDTVYDVRFEGGSEESIRSVSDYEARTGSGVGSWQDPQSRLPPNGNMYGQQRGHYDPYQQGTNGYHPGADRRMAAAPPAPARSWSGVSSVWSSAKARPNPNGLGLRDCAVQASKEPRKLVELLHEVIGEWEPDPRDVVLPARKRSMSLRFMDKMKLSCGLGIESEEHQERKTLHRQIRHLRERKRAASQLLDELEKEVVEIEKQLEERVAHGVRLQRAMPPPGIAEQCCQGWNDDGDEVVLSGNAAVHGGIVELRPVLRSRLEESELSLHETKQELQKLQYELRGVQEQNKALSGTSLKITQRSSDLRKNLVQRYAASFRSDDSNSIRVVFMTWLALITQRKQIERSAMQGALAVMRGVQKSPEKECFILWRNYVRRDMETRRRREAIKQESVIRTYAAKLLMSSFTSIVQAVLAAWWKVTLDVKLARKLDSAEQVKDERHAGATYKEVTEVMVHMISAKGLRAADTWNKSSDPYCICEVPGKPHTRCQTEVKSKNLAPVWEQASHAIVEYKDGENLRFTVKDKDRGKSDDVLGSALLRAPDFFPNGFHGEILLTEQSRTEPGEMPPKLTVKVEVKVRKVQTAHAVAAAQGSSSPAAQSEVALAAAEAARAAIQALREDEDRRKAQTAANAASRPCCIVM